MICNKCGKEIIDGAKFCDKCGKKVKNQEGVKKKNKLTVIIVSSIAVISLVTGFIFINNLNKNTDKTNTQGSSNIASNAELILVDDTAPNGATYAFTLEDVKRSIDKSCKENNINGYNDFELVQNVDSTSIYISYKDATMKDDCFIVVRTFNNYVAEIKFNYYDEKIQELTSGEYDVFFNILKDNYKEDYSNQIKSILENLQSEKYEFYNNTLCYTEKLDNFGTIEYTITAITDESYSDMMKNNTGNSENTENEESTNINTSESTIDRETFLNNLTEDDKEYIKKYVKYTFDLTNDKNFVEDRIEIVGNELIYIYLNIDLKQAGGTTVYSTLCAKYYSIMPIIGIGIPENWKQIDLSILSNYLSIGELTSEDIARLPGAGLTDEQVNNGIAEANPKIQEKIDKYKEIHNSSLSEEGKDFLLNKYLEYTAKTQKTIDSEFNPAFMKIQQNPDKWEYVYIKEINENKTLYVKFYEKSTIAQNYKETDSTEYCAMGILIDINFNNIPVFFKTALEKGTPINWDSAIQLLIKNKAIPEISNSFYVVTPIKKETTKGNTYTISNEFINYICSHFGV